MGWLNSCDVLSEDEGGLTPSFLTAEYENPFTFGRVVKVVEQHAVQRDTIL